PCRRWEAGKRSRSRSPGWRPHPRCWCSTQAIRSASSADPTCWCSSPGTCRRDRARPTDSSRVRHAGDPSPGGPRPPAQSGELAPVCLHFDAVDFNDPAALAAAWRDTTRLVWVESPTSPLLAIVDIAAVAEYAHEREARCVVDNTFATHYLQRPLELGADVVVHSTTKYLGGHSDVVGRFVA